MRVNCNKKYHEHDMQVFFCTTCAGREGCPRPRSRETEKSDIVARAHDSGVSGIRPDPLPNRWGNRAILRRIAASDLGRQTPEGVG